MDDSALTATVRTRLAAMGLGPSTRVDVDTYDGTVYLSGEVADDDTKRRIEVETRNVPHAELVVASLFVRSSPAEGPASARTAIDPARRLGSARRRSIRYWSAAGGSRGSRAIRWGGRAARSSRTITRGRLVAILYAVPMCELAELGVGGPEARRRIHHVTIYPVVANADVPDPQYHIVLWHLSRSAKSLLR